MSSHYLETNARNVFYFYVYLAQIVNFQLIFERH